MYQSVVNVQENDKQTIHFSRLLGSRVSSCSNNHRIVETSCGVSGIYEILYLKTKLQFMILIFKILYFSYFKITGCKNKLLKICGTLFKTSKI